LHKPDATQCPTPIDPEAGIHPVGYCSSLGRPAGKDQRSSHSGAWKKCRAGRKYPSNRPVADHQARAEFDPNTAIFFGIAPCQSLGNYAFLNRLLRKS
jgi:hypothetical protein